MVVNRDSKNKPKLELWQTSKANTLLIRLLSDKDSHIHNVTPEQAWEPSKCFQKDRFTSNMKNDFLEARGGIFAENVVAYYFYVTVTETPELFLSHQSW